MESIDTLIKVIEKCCLKERTYKVECDPHVVVHETFKQQGVREAIAILQSLHDGNLKAADVLK